MVEILSKDRKKVVIAMSGGVDSTFSAHILKKEGYDLYGMMLKVYSEVSKCCSIDDINDAKNVAKKLEIPFKLINCEKRFKNSVIKYFVDTYFEGKTPLPCALCNKVIKFPVIIEEAKKIGIDKVATGHYVNIKKDKNGLYSLYRGLDKTKDQTYFLYKLDQNILKHLIFPVGNYLKSDIKKVANDLNLVSDRKKESQEVCFVPKDYKTFLEDMVDKDRIKKGKILTVDGKIVGDHLGLHRYTIGQRKGLNIAMGYPVYVVDIDFDKNIVIIGDNKDLLQKKVYAVDTNWLTYPPKVGEELMGKVRYRQQLAICKVVKIDHKTVEVEFKDDQRAVTSGQALVLYSLDGEKLIGGGTIEKN